MPWQTTTPMSQRLEFIQAVLHRRDGDTFKAICGRFGVHEKTGHKWFARFQAGGPEALADRSHAPHVAAHQVPPERQAAICALREAHPSWGARKLRVVLMGQHPEVSWPAASTITTVLKRHGLVAARSHRRRERSAWAAGHLTQPVAPNDVWAADFKGQFRVGTGAYCYPLTVSDLHARYVLSITALPSVAAPAVEAAFRHLFQLYGLPRVIRTDNGVPFGAPQALGGLSRLAVWWIRLGIRPERIRKGEPQENGAHERMHRTLKAETTRPVSKSIEAQQRRFHGWREVFNTQRPHEALGQTPPALHYATSPRPLPRRLPPLDYPPHHELRRVSQAGAVSWHGSALFLSEVLAGEYVSLHEAAEGVWSIHFGPLTLGQYHQDTLHFTEALAWNAPLP